MPRFVTLLLLCVIAAALRCHGLAERSLWFDEASSYTYATQFGLRETLERSALNVHPPLHYFVLKLWIDALGGSLVTMRLLSVVFGVGTVAAVYWFCRDAFPESADGAASGAEVGFVAAGLLAVSAPHVLLSQQCRMYTQGTFLAVFSSWLLVRGLRANANAVWWVGYALAASALLYSHSFSIFSVFAQFVIVAGLVGHRLWTNAGTESLILQRSAAAFATVLVIYAPWLPVLMTQSARVRSDYWGKGVDLNSLPVVLQELFLAQTLWSTAAGLICVGAAIALGIALVWNGSSTDWMLLAMGGIPIAGGMLLALTGTGTITARFLSFGHVFLVMAIARLACRPSLLRTRRILACAGVAMFAAVSLCTLSNPARYRPGLAAAVRYVLANRRGAEPVAVLHPCLLHATRYHAGGASAVKLFATARSFSHYGAGPFLRDDDVISPAELACGSADRLWIIDTTGFGTIEGYRLPSSWRRDAATRADFPEVEEFQGVVTASRYQREFGSRP